VLTFTNDREISLNCFQRLLENNLRQAGTAESNTFDGASRKSKSADERREEERCGRQNPEFKRGRSPPGLIYFVHREKDGAVRCCKSSQKRPARHGISADSRVGEEILHARHKSPSYALKLAVKFARAPRS
jgi:hypothetical protein